MEKKVRKGHPAGSGKRWLALLMCLCLIGTMLPVTARAEDGSAVSDVTEDKVITDWEWVDDWEIIDPDSKNVLLPFASKDNIAYFDDIVEMLPAAISADGEELTLGEWVCEDYPMESGAYEGGYVFETTLPEGYVLSEDRNKLCLTVVLGAPEGNDAAVYAHEPIINTLTPESTFDVSKVQMGNFTPREYQMNETGTYTLTGKNSYETTMRFVIKADCTIILDSVKIISGLTYEDDGKNMFLSGNHGVFEIAEGVSVDFVFWGENDIQTKSYDSPSNINGIMLGQGSKVTFSGPGVLNLKGRIAGKFLENNSAAQATVVMKGGQVNVKGIGSMRYTANGSAYKGEVINETIELQYQGGSFHNDADDLDADLDVVRNLILLRTSYCKGDRERVRIKGMSNSSIKLKSGADGEFMEMKCFDNTVYFYHDLKLNVVTDYYIIDGDNYRHFRHTNKTVRDDAVEITDDSTIAGAAGTVRVGSSTVSNATLTFTSDLFTGSCTTDENGAYYKAMPQGTYRVSLAFPGLEQVFDAGEFTLSSETKQTYNVTKDALSGIMKAAYLDQNGDIKEHMCRLITENDTELNADSFEGWYAAWGEISIGDVINVNGDVHLILIDGCDFTAGNGICVADGKSLTIYGQTKGSGKLTATTDSGQLRAGIGSAERKSADITINGGTVNATGGNASAGIGGGARSTGGNITINGGTVNATSGFVAPGIGSGFEGSVESITIRGGTVNATGGAESTNLNRQIFGIGSGFKGSVGSITISGGTVTAIAGSGGSGYGFSQAPTMADSVLWKVSVGSNGDSLAGVNKNNVTDSTYTGNKAVKIEVCADHEADSCMAGPDNTHSGTCKWCNTAFTEPHSPDQYAADNTNKEISVKCGACGTKFASYMLIAPAAESLIYNGAAKKATVKDTISNSTVTDVTITYTKEGDESFTGFPVDVGIYTASINLTDSKGTKTVSVNYEIQQATPDIGTVSAEVLKDTFDISAVQFSRSNTTVAGKVSLKEGTTLHYGTNDCEYVFTPTDTVNYKPIKGRVSVTVKDTLAPTVSVKIRTNGLKSIFNSGTFGYFFKDTQEIEVEVSDSGTGIDNDKIWYYISDTALTEGDVTALGDGKWSSYDNSNKPSITQGTYFVYVKATDKSGNTAYVGTDGIVIYEDSTPAKASIGYTYNENNDKTVTITLNGNTVAAIKDKDGKALVKDTDYSVADDGTITITKSYLDGLDVSDTPYTLTVSYNPQGEAYKENLYESSGNDLNDAPAETVISVMVKKAGLTVTGATATDRKYDTTNKAVITAVTLSGIKGTDVVCVNTTGLTGTLSSANTGKYTSVTLPEMTLTGDDAGNYTLVQPTDAVPTNVTISKADAQINAGTATYDKTFGDAAFNLGVTDTNADEDLVYTVSDSKNAAGTSVENDKVITVDENGYVTIVGAGGAEITVSLPASTNYNEATSKITVTVAKKSGYTVADINKSCVYSRDNAENIDLSKYLPANCGTVTYGTPQTSGTVEYTVSPAVADGKLSYTVKTGSVGAAGTIKVNVTTGNYEDFTLAVNVNLTDKTLVSLSGITCGNRVYNGTAYSYTGTPVWKTEEGKTADGKTTVTYYKAGEPSALAEAPVNAGSYLAEFSIESDDYVGTASYSFEITRAVITAAAIDRNIYTSDTVPDLANPVLGTDYTVTGLCGTDALGGTVSLSYGPDGQEPDNTKEGTYEIRIGGLTAPEGDNYTITFTKGTLAITTKPSGGGGSGSSTGGGGSSGSSSGSSGTTGSREVSTSKDSGSNTATTTSKTEVKVESGTASATVKAENVTEAIKQAADNKSAEIVFNVSAEDTKDTDRIQLTITKADVKQILDKTSADLVTATTAGNVILPKEALKEVVSAAGGDDITIAIHKVTAPTAEQKEAAGENSYIVEVTVTSQNKAITSFGGNPLKIRLEIPAALAGKDVAVIHIAEDGKTEKLPGKMVTEGTKQYYEFTTTHLSTFALIEETGTKEEAPADTAPKKGTLLTDTKTQMVYKVTKSGADGGTVQFVKSKDTKAKTVAIPDKVTFDGISYKVTSIAAGALKNNKTVTTVTIGRNVAAIGSGAFSGCTKLKKVTVGRNVTAIGSGAFSGCTRLKKMTIGKNVTAIGSKAFYNCSSLTALTIPSKVEKIGNYAFGGLRRLKTIRIKTKLLTTKTVSEYAFLGISTRTVIKVPKSRLKTYKTLFGKKGLDKKVVIKK